MDQTGVRRATILVVEDEPLINEAVGDRLRAEGHLVVALYDGPGAVLAFTEHRPDLVVLDVMLPGFDGLEVCRRIQQQRPVPVLMLTARDDESDVLVGLGVGADDYLTKPFRMRELVARVAALLRRVERSEQLSRETGEALQVGALRLDAGERRTWLDGAEVHLTPTEFDLARTLARACGQVLTRERLLAEVWGWDGGAGATRKVGRTAGDRLWQRVSLGALCLLTLVVVASALHRMVHRMDLYQDAYGFTRLRLLVDLFEGWLGLVVLGALAAGIGLRGAWLPRMALLSGAALMLALAVANPDAWIARHNLDRFEATGKLDTSYVLGLSDDALPTLVGRDPGLARCAVERRDRPDDSWSGWNLGRERASAAQLRLGERSAGNCAPDAGESAP